IKPEAQALPCPKEFMKMSESAPLGDQDVALLVQGRAMGGIADALLPLFWRKAEVGALFLVRIVTELGDDLAVLVQDSDPPLQLRDDGVIASDVHGGGHAQTFLDDFHEMALEIPVFDPIVVPVANEQERLVLASVQGYAVTGLELSLLFSGPA